MAVIAIGVNVVTPRPDPNAFAAQRRRAQRPGLQCQRRGALQCDQTGQVRLTTVSGDPVPDKDYELWAIEGSAAPKSLGVIKIDARNDVKAAGLMCSPASAPARRQLPSRSSRSAVRPTPAPTGPIVAAGKATPDLTAVSDPPPQRGGPTKLVEASRRGLR